MRRVAMLVAALVLSATANAAEVSFLSGLYKQEKEKVEGENAGETSEIEIGGRFADEYDTDMTWFGQLLLTMRNYDEPDGGKSPSDSTSLALGGGLRMYFDAFSESVRPFAYGLLEYVSDKQAEFQGLGYRETERNGLYYGLHTGIRFRYDQVVFMDLEVPLFTSALNATTTVETNDGAGNESKSETTNTELYMKSDESFNQVTVVIGMMI